MEAFQDNRHRIQSSDCKCGSHALSALLISGRSDDAKRLDRNTNMAWSNDCSGPVTHEDIIAILEAIRARSIADTFLAFLELLEEAEIARN